MAYALRIALWNANGLAQHSQELKTFIHLHNIDIMLISETHFTNMNSFRLPGYITYNTNVPDGRAHGGSAVIIKSNISHYELPKHESEKIQATSVTVLDWIGPLTVSAAYCPPRHRLSKEDFTTYFNTLGPRFIAGADYNAKCQHWGSRLTTPRGRVLLKTIEEQHLSFLSTSEPTYWPTDQNRLPDLLDFFVTKGFLSRYTDIKSCLDLSSDHSPIILSISTAVKSQPPPLVLHNRFTDWNNFREELDATITCNVPLQCENDIDMAINLLTTSIQQAAWNSTPQKSNGNKSNNHDIPQNIKIAIAQKRRLRRIWQNSRQPVDKRNFNNATQILKRMLFHIKNESFKNYLEQLDPTEATNYSLWKVTKGMKRPHQPIPPIRKTDGSWAKNSKEKAETIAQYLVNVFKPFPSNGNCEDNIHETLEAPYQMSLPVKSVKLSEIKKIIKTVNPNKAPGFDLITGRILKELPEKVVRLITIIFNAILRVGYFPDQWKVAQIIVVPKPGKPLHDVTSYRPISLLPIMSKLLEKIILERLRPILDQNDIIPSYQFGFRPGHSTLEQVHRVVNIINSALEEKKFCSAAFLDIRQAFDKVWHTGLLSKIKYLLPHPFFVIIKSFLSNRFFTVKFQTEETQMFPIQAGVPQGSVLAPILYSIYTADMPVTDNTTTATYADDTTVQAVHKLPHLATQHLQEHLNLIQVWQKKWRIRINETKSTHVTFTLKQGTCPPVFMNNTQIPQTDTTKYLGIHLDRRLNWRTHIVTKRKQLDLKFKQLYWLLGRTSTLTLSNKTLVYKTILKPIWTYGIQLWGTASDSNIQIIQRFQSKLLRNITDAPWYVTNKIIHNDLTIPTVKDEIRKYSLKYQTRLEAHTNDLAINILDNSNTVRRLKRKHPTDLF